MPVLEQRQRGLDEMPTFNLASAKEFGARAPEAVRAYVLERRRCARRALDSELLRTLEGLGFAARELCTRELSADLADLGVCELLQAITNGRKDATIDLFQDAFLGRIWCAGGQIVDAASGRLAGEAAVYRLLAVDQGELVADFRAVRRRPTVESSTLTLMLEASRRKDECALIERRLGGIQRAYRTDADARGVLDAESLAGELLAAFAAGAPIATVLENAELDDLSVLQAIASLVERGALVPSEQPQSLILLKPPAMTPQAPRADMTTALSDAAHPPRSAWRAAGAIAGAAGALALLGLLLRSNGAHVPDSDDPRAEAQQATGTPALEPAGAAAPTSPARPARDNETDSASSYRVQVIAEPESAELWLDGTRVATGEVSLLLDRTGQTHELRVVAPDHQPQTLLFRDTPPPLTVRLLPAEHSSAARGAAGATTAPVTAPAHRP